MAQAKKKKEEKTPKDKIHSTIPSVLVSVLQRNRTNRLHVDIDIDIDIDICMLQEGRLLPGPKSGLSSNTRK